MQDAGFFTFVNLRVDYTFDFFNTIPLIQELINSGGPPPSAKRLSLLAVQSARACALWQEEDQQQGQEAARDEPVLHRASDCTSTSGGIVLNIDRLGALSRGPSDDLQRRPRWHSECALAWQPNLDDPDRRAAGRSVPSLALIVANAAVSSMGQIKRGHRG